MTLSREQILAAEDTKRELVPVPEWGGEVYVGTMTGAARDAWEASIITADGKPSLQDVRAKLVVACTVDEGGNRLFTEADVKALSAKSGVALERIVKVARRLNVLSEKDLEAVRGN